MKYIENKTVKGLRRKETACWNFLFYELSDVNVIVKSSEASTFYQLDCVGN